MYPAVDPGLCFENSAGGESAFVFPIQPSLSDERAQDSMPAAINEVLWSVGITTYNAVYARIGTDAIAAVNINATIEELVFVLFIGLGNACAVMVGNKIGAGGKRSCLRIWTPLYYPGCYRCCHGRCDRLFIARDGHQLVSNLAIRRRNLRGLMLVYALSIMAASLQLYALHRRIARGGDTRYAMFTELFSIWVIGVPCGTDRRICSASPCVWSLCPGPAGGSR